jgi:hypothetical protein
MTRRRRRKCTPIARQGCWEIDDLSPLIRLQATDSQALVTNSCRVGNDSSGTTLPAGVALPSPLPPSININRLERIH